MHQLRYSLHVELQRSSANHWLHLHQQSLDKSFRCCDCSDEQRYDKILESISLPSALLYNGSFVINGSFTVPSGAQVSLLRPGTVQGSSSFAPFSVADRS